MKKMYNAGCRFIYYGVESGSQKVLNSMRKGVVADTITKVLKATSDNGIWSHAYLLFGYPTETKEDLLETIDMVIDNNDSIDSYIIHPFILIKGKFCRKLLSLFFLK